MEILSSTSITTNEDETTVVTIYRNGTTTYQHTTVYRTPAPGTTGEPIPTTSSLETLVPELSIQTPGEINAGTLTGAFDRNDAGNIRLLEEGTYSTDNGSCILPRGTVIQNAGIDGTIHFSCQQFAQNFGFSIFEDELR